MGFVSCPKHRSIRLSRLSLSRDGDDGGRAVFGGGGVPAWWVPWAGSGGIDRGRNSASLEHPRRMLLCGRALHPSIQDQANLEAERQKINTVVRNLQRELEESAEETGHWRDMFQKNKDELRTTKQE